MINQGRKLLRTIRVYISNEKGLSAVEMMAAITIAGIILGAVASFLTVHIKSFETTVDVIDVQYEGQLAMNAIGSTAMESMGIYQVEDSSGIDRKLDDVELTDPRLIVFRTREDKGMAYYYIASEQKIVFKPLISATSSAVYDSTTEDSWYDFAFHVKSWTIDPGLASSNIQGDDFAYNTTDNMHIYIEFENDDVYMDLSNSFKFRNYNMR